MCPPTEICDHENVKTMFSTSQKPIWFAIGSTPRRRATMTVAAMTPNTAPDAPAVNAFGVTSSAPNDPPSSETA